MGPHNMTAPVIRTPEEFAPVDRRTILIAVLAVLIAIGAGLAAEVLTRLIGLVTNLAFYDRVSTVFVSPGEGHRHAAALLLIPILGALVVGVMARYGSAAIRGHGIPEVMEKVLFGESRISARVLFLKPLSAAIAIGTGGPFGAEGPIIATGGALGSVAGQLLTITTDERKTLLAAGAAAGMAATFGSPVSAVLLAIELLLFEYRARSLIPVALAAAAAASVRVAFHGTAPVFAIPDLAQPGRVSLAAYTVLGVIIGVCAAGITRFTYGLEDLFEHVGSRLGIHWMWWPAMGAVVVGVVGLVEPRTLGVGYENIMGAIGGRITGEALLILGLLKLLSWAVYLSSGTSGGTMAPLFTIGSCIGAWIGLVVSHAVPALGVNPQVAGLVGMAAMFAGASHALLASIIFAFETTRQPLGMLPLLAGCTAAYLVAMFVNRHSIMTEKLARRGAQIRTEYSVDYLSHVPVRDEMTTDLVTLKAKHTLAAARSFLASNPQGTHQGFPVLDDAGLLVGVVTRRDLLDTGHPEGRTIAEIIRRAPIVVFEDSTLRDAADQMVIEQVGRLPVVRRDDPRIVVGIVSRSDLLAAHVPRLQAAR
ncbi:MAG TPA: chloride channel protein, partial [Gemmatimonadaceae bacterium]|nr:chloride channel protein [Gemmatimonadaceae bacterium]